MEQKQSSKQLIDIYLFDRLISPQIFGLEIGSLCFFSTVWVANLVVSDSNLWSSQGHPWTEGGGGDHGDRDVGRYSGTRIASNTKGVG